MTALRLPLISALLLGTAASATAAAALPAARLPTNAATSAVAKVHYDSRYGDRGWRHYRPYHHPRYYRGEVVDAPFTHVETGRRTIVDAPFVHVYSGRRGQHIVAPFVDLWVPY